MTDARFRQRYERYRNLIGNSPILKYGSDYQQESLLRAWQRRALVEYLRLSIAWGGMPGWSFQPDRAPAALAALRTRPDF